MSTVQGVQGVQDAFDPEALAVLKSAFDDACSALPAGQQTVVIRAQLAQRILHKAREGERDPVALRAYALEAVTPSMWREAG
jgi:hypothetical protein